MSFETFILLIVAIAVGIFIGIQLKIAEGFLLGCLQGLTVLIPIAVTNVLYFYLSSLFIQILPSQYLWLWLTISWLIWFILIIYSVILYINITRYGWREGLKISFKK